MKMLMMLVLCLALALTGCIGRYENGPELTERVVVTEVVYTPATHGSGVGMSTGGNAVFTSVSTEPVYAVVFQCDHGKFIVKRRDVWEQCVVGDTLVCHYREQFWVTETERKLVDYDFLHVAKR